MPSYRVINHMDTDQYYYTNGAVSFLHYNQFYTPFPPGKDYTRNLFDFFENIWTAPFLKLFGNNLFAFKLPTLLLSLWAIYLIFCSLKLLKINRRIINIATLFLLAEFMLFISSRVQNPTIYSFFGCSMLIFLLIKYETSETEKEKNKFLFFSGLWVVWTVFLIYIFNFFLLAALGFSVLVYFGFVKKSFKSILIFGVGCLVGFLLYNFLTYLVYEKTVLNLLNDLRHFGGGDDYRSLDELKTPFRKKIIKTFAAFFTINFLRFNLFLFVIFTPALVFFILKIIKEKSISLLNMVLLSSLIFTLCQLWFEPTYSPKKLTTLLPIYILIIVQSINNFVPGLLSQKRKLLLASLGVLGLMSALYCYSITTASWYEALRAGQNTPYYLNYLNFGMAVLMMFMLIYVVFKGTSNKFVTSLVSVLIFIPSLGFVFKYVILDRSYNFKNSLVELSGISEGKNMAGDYPEALMLYNNFHSYRPYHTYKSTDEIYRLLENDSVQIINLQTEKSMIKGYNYNDNRVLKNKKINDTLLSGKNYFVLVDLILNINQGKEVYVGVRRNKLSSN